MSASENQERPQPHVFAGVSMRELLAAGVAAQVISTPPEAPPVEQERKAA